MPALVSIIVVIGFTFLVILGAVRVFADLLAMSSHPHPSFPEEFPEEDRESLDRNVPDTSSAAVQSAATSAAAGMSTGADLSCT
jgi:hypothetical protein